jgi:tetratricopeptide (TPR) repeat protein
VIDANPADPTLPVARGYSRLETDPAGATADFGRALSLDPKNARAHLGRGLLLRRIDPRGALAEIERALSIDPDFLDAIQARALLRARLGDPAAEADVSRILQAPTPLRFYNAACALALLSRSAANRRLVPRAIELLRHALDAGLPPRHIAEDPDLDALRDSPQFSALCDKYRVPARTHRRAVRTAIRSSSPQV